MRAMRLATLGQAARIENVEDPVAGPSEVVVEVIAASLSAGDVAAQTDAAADLETAGYSAPRTLGQFFAGRVVAAGAAVEHCSVGELVVTSPIGTCDNCQPCLNGMSNYCINPNVAKFPRLGVDRDGGLANLVSVPSRMVLATNGVPAEIAAPASDRGLIAYHAIRMARYVLAPGNNAVVIGGNAAARYAIGILSQAEGIRVIAVADEVEQLAARTGSEAETLLDPTDATGGAIRDLIGGFGANCVLDFVGSEASAAFAGAAVTQGGAIVVAGASGGFVPVGAGRLNRNASARYVTGGSRGDLRELLDVLVATPIPVNASTVSLDRAPVVSAESDPTDVPVVVIP